jgi:hypothetical protein
LDFISLTIESAREETRREILINFPIKEAREMIMCNYRMRRFRERENVERVQQIEWKMKKKIKSDLEVGKLERKNFVEKKVFCGKIKGNFIKL